MAPWTTLHGRGVGIAHAALLGAAVLGAAVLGAAGLGAATRPARERGSTPHGRSRALQPYTATTSPNAAVVMNVLWRITRPTRGGTEVLTTSDPAERDRVGRSGEASAVAYVPAASAPGRAPLYRLLSPNGHHMDSAIPNERGSVREGALGFPWASAGARSTFPGLTQLVRPKPASAGTEPLPLYGYSRYGRLDTAFATLSAGGVTVRSNLVAGCSLWSWRSHGVEFVNVHDLGRQIQTSAGFAYNGVGVLPTEAGSTYSGSAFAGAMAQSAPCVSVTTADASTASPTQRTRAVPLEWQPAALGGGPSNPVAWPRMLLGKDITLNYAGLGPVARYTTVVSVPTVPTGLTGVEIPSVYLNGEFRDLTLYDAAADTSTRLTTVCGVMYGLNPKSGYGGVIAASADGARAFGLYAAHIERWGFRAGLGYARFNCGGTGRGSRDDATTKLRGLTHAVWSAGENRFTTYLISGTKADVVRLMRRLYTLDAA